ncbi:hypothetical protein LOTGIDRAFT_230048 [Lottia gigantea]|uniref:Lipocalin/cytosolic fatty-acid binding domain-containing protein n=1 Tax=Lottia gigantea TaxID=225164 RepID=V4BBP7_LOTGI|nr:hypothetical protein LOTGIDRAFT_230048 [Lottia gigantea]ESP05011.1 hypothetical protein LOTGIDRAFT_230048 [Lottia gigantea]
MATNGLFVGLIVLLTVTQVYTTCVIPTALQGTWDVQGRTNTLTFTSSMLVGVKLDQFPNIVFNCFTHSGNEFVFRSNLEELFGVSVKIYFCLDFDQVSSSEYKMYELTHKVGLYYEDRARAFLLSDDPNVTKADVCQLSRSTVTPRIMIKR